MAAQTDTAVARSTYRRQLHERFTETVWRNVEGQIRRRQDEWRPG